MKPHVSILMVTSVDGRLHPSRFTASPEGTRRDWTGQYEKVHASSGRTPGWSGVSLWRR